LYTFAGGTALGGWAYFGVYFLARALHSLFYLNASQPMRTIMFFVGQLTQLGIIVQLLMKAF